MVQHPYPAPDLSILNGHPSLIPGPKLLHDLVLAASDLPALDFLENGSTRRQITYSTLHALSDRLAAKILSTLAKLENASAIIPVLLPQSPELYISLLAILKAGKAFCPLNLDTPEERLKFILNDLSATLVITDCLHEGITRSGTEVQALVVDHELSTDRKHASLASPSIDTNDLAYVLYTSGSTGLPKAVSVSHRAVTQSLLAHDRHIPEFTRFLQFAAPTFDVSIFEIFFPWYRGQTLVGCTRIHMLNDLPGTVRALEVDAAELTPTVVSNLLHGRKSVPGLKLLLTIGEMLPQRVVDEFGGSDSQTSILWGMYGPTEAAIHCTLQPSFASNAPVGTIGFPLDTTSALVIAPPSKTVSPTAITVLPVGEVGELAIGGLQVADGYRNRPELTAASFINDPKYGLLYRTGDKARLRSDGMLECLGRLVSGQVKIRGQRVELGEIEQTLATVDGCQSASALVIEDNLVAFCAIGSHKVTQSDVIEKCKRWLPIYMVPTDVYFIPNMPQLPSGKIDKKALEAQYLNASRQQDQPVTMDPDDQMGLSILQILEQHLGHHLSLGSHLSFAGLDSLRSIGIASTLREAGFNLGAMDVLSAKTLEELIAVCENSQNIDLAETSPSLDLEKMYDAVAPGFGRNQGEIADIFPCSPLQEAMLTETMMRPRAYCNWVEVELSLTRTYDELRSLLQTVIQENEILRSGFCTVSTASGTFAQVIWNTILPSQIREVTEFSRGFSLGSTESLLHPLAIQVKLGPGKPRILFQIHHALYDGWSFDLLLQDLNSLLHGNEINGRPQYREVVAYMVQEQTAKAREGDRAYWAKLLQGYSPTPLPNFNGKLVGPHTLRSISGKSSVDLSFLLERSRQFSVNPQVFFQVATAYMLALYTGSTNITMGTVTSGRTIPMTGVEEVIGPCIATLPCRFDFANSITVQDTLVQTQSLNREMLHHCILPLREIVKQANVRSGTRLFDVLFVWQQSLNSAPSASSAVRTVATADDLEFGVTLEFEPRDDCIYFRVTYDPSIIPEQQVRYLSQQVDDIVQSFLDEPQGQLSAVSTVHNSDNLSIANPSPKYLSFEHGPAYAVEKWASQSPHKDAINIGHIKNGIMAVEEKMTYGELNVRANQLARALLEHGIAKDELICIIMDKSIELYVTILAVLKVGSGYLPIVPDTPMERIKTIMMDAEISLCLSHSSVSQGLEEQLLTTILDVDQMDFPKHSDQNLDVEYNGSHLAYAVWTSGSTGIPKGVLVTQDNLMSNLEYLSGIYPTSDDSRMLQACSQAFDVSVFEIFFSWYVGMCLCTASKDDIFYDLESAINCLGVTHLSLTPTVAALVNPTKVPNVRFLVTAGEGVTEHVRRQWTGRGLFQGYGPSETTNICTVRASMNPDDLINNIGPPFDNTSAFVMDPGSNAILPRGAVGELCFGGQQVFRGYLNRPELNAQKIINHPLYGRLYRSGDMGILLPDDSILFTGRSDDQVKIRGQRVELGEITSIVLDIDGVKDCATLLLDGEGGTQRLVTFWVPIQVLAEGFKTLCPVDFRFTIHGIFESLTLQLPSYMIPSHLMPITEIPMTSQGKIDKRLLRTTFNDLTDGCLECSASSFDVSGGRRGIRRESMSSLEKDVARVLAQTLNLPLDEIRRNSSFFHLGLDSVSAIRFSSGLRASGMGNLPVSTILKNSTIGSLCSTQKITRSSVPRSSDNQLLSLAQVFQDDQLMQILYTFQNEGVAVTKMLPCTPLQEAMLSTPDSQSESAYCNTTVFEVKGELNRLQQCWTIMFQRHEILRTTFVAIDDPQYAFAQVVLEYEEMSWEKVKVDSHLQKRAQKQLSQRLESSKPPVWLAIDDTGSVPKLIFSCHHALYDGTAVSTLLTEIQQIYHGSELLPPVPYERYLRHMVAQDLQAADRFWTSSFIDFEPTLFPCLTGKVVREEPGVSISIRSLNTSLSETLGACKDMSVSLLPIIQAVWVKLLHIYLGENDLCFGNVVSGRILPESGLGRLVAPCFNTLPVRLNFDFQKTNAELVKKLHDFNIEVMPYQLTPLRRIQSAVLKEGGRLFDSLVILQQPSELLDDSIWSLERDIGHMALPVVCEVVQDQVTDTLRLMLHYQTSIMSEEDARVITETFDNCLQSVIQFPQFSARDVVGFPEHLLAQANMEFSRLAPADGELLHSGFESNAVLLANAVALDFQHANGSRTTWTFEALNAKANSIAHALIEVCVQCEDIIPIHIQKSPEFYASVLGILKAGAAFTPIHPDLPEARKQFMLSELKPKAMVCIGRSYPYGWCEGVELIDVDELIVQFTENPVIQGLRPTNLAYCLYTSGSTGVPKAVSMEHRSPLQTVESSRSLIPWDYESRLLQYAAITFDMCYFDCFLAWTFGFTLCAAEQETMLNRLPDTINALQVDLLDLTPSVAVSLPRSEVPGVKWMYCIGETMSLEVIRNWEGSCINSYGPTEAAFCTTMFSASSIIKPSIIGAPFPTTSFAVFPADGERPLPILGVGELYIGGTQLARGYLGKLDLTEERFVYKCGQRFYKSGDFVRMMSDGHFEFLGRADDQVKIRGLRVELGEINNVLQGSDPNIASVSVQILKKDASSKDQLVAFITTRHPAIGYEHIKLRNKLKQAAATQLPLYMVPQFFLFIEKIPKSMAGKVDRNALARIFCESNEVRTISNGLDADSLDHEWTDVELCVRGILGRLCKTPEGQISPTVSIYQLGLDSISAVQISTALRKHGFTVNAADVMKHMNCTDIATHISLSHTPQTALEDHFDFAAFHQSQVARVTKSTGIKHGEIEAIRPCTPLQQGMLSQFIAKDGAVYFNYLRLKLETGVNLSKLKEAWKSAMKKHVMLRTGFVHINGNHKNFVMVHYKEAATDLPWQATTTTTTTVAPLRSSNDWLNSLQRNAVKKLHSPPWAVRPVEQEDTIYLEVALLHALFDAQSLAAIFDDVAATYSGLPTQLPAYLEPLLSGILQMSSDERNDEFWRKLGKTAAPTRVPNMAPLRYAPLPPRMLAKSASRSLCDLETGCQKADITLQAAGIASWLSVLSAYTGEQSVTCGVVLSGRNFEAAESAVFPCITTVPFPCTVTENKKGMLKEIMMLCAEVQQHQFTPLTTIQRLMGYANEALFDSIFAFQKFSKDESKEHPWTVVNEKATTEYPISIELEPRGHQLEYRLTFLPHIIPKRQALLILEQLDHFMTSFIFSETTPDSISPIIYSITPAKEPTLPSEAKLLHQMVELTALKYPDRAAFEFATSIRNGKYISKTWTYAEMNAEGNRIANFLASQDVHPGSLIGVCFDKCPEASFAMLGILKAGCAFVAIDPGAPSARQSFIVKDSHSVAVLSMKAQSVGFKNSIETPLFNLDEVDLSPVSSNSPSLSRNMSPHDRSYCLYTSGTTGTPKGCELSHENVVQAMLAFQRLFAGHWDDRSRWLQFASFHFDVSVLEQYWSWAMGICVVSASRDLIFEDLAESISTLDITHIDLTPSLARLLHPDDVPSLCRGVFITGGESLKQEILDVWGPRSVIYNGYGPTEATIGVTMYPRVPDNGKPSNIGPQFENVGSLVLKLGTDIPVLRGGIGELCVSGKLVGKGYLNRPDLTNERFPYLERFNERVYRTGDLVRILYDGSFDFIGRADDQVKLRGQRLEIGEINSVIKQSGRGISDLATLVLKHPKQQKEQLVSFVVIGSTRKGEPQIILEKSTDVERARDECQDKLPIYMVPTHFVALTKMPLNINHKADGRKLKEMYESLSINDLQVLSATSRPGDDKWTTQESKLRDVISEVLEIDGEAIGKDASLFELGMDSISVIWMSKSMKQAGFSFATVSEIMTNASVRRLTKVLSNKNSSSKDRGSVIAAQQSITAAQHRHRRAVAEALFVDAREIHSLAPCTPLQQGMIAKSLENEQGLYFNTFIFNLHDGVDTAKLRAAWEEVYASAQILRTAFANTGDGYVQAVLRRSPLTWKNLQVPEGFPVDECLGKLRKNWLGDNVKALRRPLEVILLNTPTQKLLCVHIFHALYDGNSINMVFKMLWDAYNNISLDKEVHPFQSVLPFGPLRQVEGAREFWKSHVNAAFRHFPPLTNTTDQAAILTSRELTDLSNFDTVRRKLNVTAQAIAQACWANLLYKHIRGPLALGMVVSGRIFDFEGADEVNGPLFNTIPYQYRLQRDDNWASLIKRAHDFNVAAHPYQHTPLREIIKWCKRGPNQPLFDTLFVYQVTDGDKQWMKNKLWELVDGKAEADYPLAIEVEQRGASLKLTLVIQGHLSDTKASEGLLDDFEASLREALSDPNIIPATCTEINEGPDDEVTSQENHAASDTHRAIANFRWTDNAIKIREEIANLAGVDLDAVTEVSSLFDLGLDSIDAIKLSSKLKKHGIDLPVSDIMRNPMIADMVERIASARTQWTHRPSNMIFKSYKQRLENYLERRGILNQDIVRALPLTPLQEAMVAEMVDSDYRRYYNHDVLRISPNTDLGKLRDAWTTVLEISPILRTSFVEVDDPNIDSSFAQIIRRDPHAFWKRIKVRGEPNFNAIFEDIRRDATIRASMLAPPFHIHIVEAPRQTYLVLSISHALYDGWSLSLLHDDVHRAYQDRLEPRPSYESALSEILTASGSDAAVFWRDYLAGAQMSSFPLRPNHMIGRHAVYRIKQCSNIDLADVTSFAKRTNITLQTLGQTVYASVLASYTQSLDIAFGSVLSGRDENGRAGLLFPTMNTVAIRAIIHGSRRGMLQYVQENFTNLKQWQHFPLRKALSLVGLQGSSFGSLFIYQKQMDEDERRGRKLYESVASQSDVEYPVCVEMEVADGKLLWRCAVKDEVFDEEGAYELLGKLDDVLENIISEPDAPALEFTAAGTSVCGMPAFQDKEFQPSDEDGQNDIIPEQYWSNSATAKAIREVLALVSWTTEEDITEDMTIFHLGLDSISAIKVSSLLRKRDIILSVGEMLKAGTVAKMAQLVDERTPRSDEAEDQTDTMIAGALENIDEVNVLRQAGLDPRDVEQVLPATAGQIYFLSMWIHSSGNTFYPEFSYKVPGHVEFELLQRSWRALVSANPILRTCIIGTKDNRIPYVQAVLREAGASIIDITGIGDEDAKMAIEEHKAQQPWAYLSTVRTPSGWDLKLKIHHALYDGVSLPLLMRQLQDICNGAGTAPPANVFNRFVANGSTTAAFEKRRAFWRNYLKGVKQHYLSQPLAPPKFKVEIFRPCVLPIAEMDAFSRKLGITTQSLFLAVYAKLYASMTITPDDDDVIIGVYLANRLHPIPDLAQAAFPTVNLLPLRVSKPGETDLLEIATQIQYDIQQISSPEHSSVSLFEIAEWATVWVDTFVNFLKLPTAEEEVASAPTGDVKIDIAGRWEENVSHVVDIPRISSGVPYELTHERVNNACLQTIDIEATVRNGALDIGVFGPAQMLNRKEGEELLENIKTVLEFSSGVRGGSK